MPAAAGPSGGIRASGLGSLRRGSGVHFRRPRLGREDGPPWASARHVMPNDPVGDSLHLALASQYKCDFLVTWNCTHLANANKFGHIRRINTILGIHVPSLVTPLELLGDDG